MAKSEGVGYVTPPRTPCSAYAQSVEFCRNGFPQRDYVCWGGGGDLPGVPFCMSEARCARMFPDTGAPSPEWVAKCRQEADRATA